MVDWGFHHHQHQKQQDKREGCRKGPWTPEEDKLLNEYVTLHGEGRWSSVAKCAGLNRSGKSCRLRWVNYLRPGLKRGQITPQEEGIIIELHALWGNKWSTIARYLPGRTDNEIKNYWRTHFKKNDKSSSKIKKAQSRKAQQPQPQRQMSQHELDQGRDIAPFIYPSNITTAMTAATADAIFLEDHYLIGMSHYTTTIEPCSSDQSMNDNESYLLGGLWNPDDGPHACSGRCDIEQTPGGNGNGNVSKVYNVDAHAQSTCEPGDYSYSAFYTGGFTI